MRSPCAAFAALILLGSAGAAEATTVAENLVGKITGSNTVDTIGLFAPAGTDLTGQTIAIYFKYTTEDFVTQKAGRSGFTSYNSQGGSNVPGSVLITVTVNGKRQVYAPAYEGVVFVQSAMPYGFVVDSDVFSGYGSGLTGAQLYVQLLGAATFGSPFSPANQPVLNKVVDNVLFYTPTAGYSPAEELTFFVSAASK